MRVLLADISRLRQDLLRNYDKNARPVQSHQNTTVVKIYFFNYGFEFVIKYHSTLNGKFKQFNKFKFW